MSEEFKKLELLATNNSFHLDNLTKEKDRIEAKIEERLKFEKEIAKQIEILERR